MNSINNKYQLKLFVAGMNPATIRAVENVKEICENHMKDNYELEIIDIYQQRDQLKDMNIIAVPTLIRLNPYPQKRLIGDMLDKKKIISVMDLKTE